MQRTHSSNPFATQNVEKAKPKTLKIIKRIPKKLESAQSLNMFNFGLDPNRLRNKSKKESMDQDALPLNLIPESRTPKSHGNIPKNFSTAVFEAEVLSPRTRAIIKQNVLKIMKRLTAFESMRIPVN